MIRHPYSNHLVSEFNGIVKFRPIENRKISTLLRIVRLMGIRCQGLSKMTSVDWFGIPIQIRTHCLGAWARKEKKRKSYVRREKKRRDGWWFLSSYFASLICKLRRKEKTIKLQSYPRTSSNEVSNTPLLFFILTPNKWRGERWIIRYKKRKKSYFYISNVYCVLVGALGYRYDKKKIARLNQRYYGY